MSIAEVLSLEERRWTAVFDADVGTLKELYSPDITYTHTDGRLESRDGYLAALESGIVRYTAAPRTNVRGQDYGSTVVLTGRLELEMEVRDSLLLKAMQFTAVWARTTGQWQLIAWHASELKP